MWRALCVLLVLAGACARRGSMPIMASQLFAEGNGTHLSAYLSQRDASAAVCDLNARGPHLATIDADVPGDLVKGLREGRIAPPLWRECVDNLVRTTDSESNARLFDDVGQAYAQLITDKNLEASADAQKRLSALHDFLVGIPSESAARSGAMDRLVARLQTATARKRLGPIGERYATELIADVELSHGMRDGRLIDLATLDTLLAANDDVTLRRYALRLPESSLRSEALRRLIRLHIEQSPYAEVRRDAPFVEDMLMRTGANPVDVGVHPIARGWIEDSLSESRTVLVRQDIEHQTSTLVGIVGDENVVSVLPQLSLRGALRLQLDGIDRPVTVCGSPEELDVSPCIPATSLRLDSRLAYLETDGTIRFVEQLTSAAAIALARSGQRLVVPIRVDSQRVAALDWRLRFAKPKDIVRGGGASGQAGPGMHVRVEQLPAGRMSYQVDADRHYFAIVERDEANSFHVISEGGEGGRGLDGSSGLDGLSGQPGSSASCPSTPAGDGGRGADGSPGEDGAAGGSGGNGGDVQVDVRASGAAGDEVLALVRKTVLSRGGNGGSGGSGANGGRGGAGGPGGAGTTCFEAQGIATTLASGAQGFSGSDGRPGFQGTSGSRGRDGRVSVRVIE